MMAAVVAAGAILAVVGNGLDLWERLFGEEAVKVTVGAAESPRVNVQAGDWAASHRSAFGPGVPERQAGVVYVVQLDADGLDGKTATLAWEVRDAFTSEVADPFPWAKPSMPFTPDGDSWSDTRDVFVPIPAVTRMQVTFRVIYDDRRIATWQGPVLGDTGGTGP
jgi:hypothetical protein